MKSKLTKSQYQEMLESHNWFYMMKSFQYNLRDDAEYESYLKKIGDDNGWSDLFESKIIERNNAIKSNFI